MAQQNQNGDTNNMMTAVEWLIEQISEKQSNGFYVIDTLEDVKRIFDKAKQMEKEQLVKAWDDGDYAYFYSKETGRDFDNGEEYYNETYGKP
jgi:hypothetical protein